MLGLLSDWNRFPIFYAFVFQFWILFSKMIFESKLIWFYDGWMATDSENSNKYFEL